MNHRHYRSRAPAGIDLTGTRDVHIGAYGRALRRRRVLLAVFGGILVIGAGALYVQLRPANGLSEDQGYPVELRCEACRTDFERNVPLEQMFPMRCPACGEQAAQPLWACGSCGERFLPGQTAGVVRCPRCRSDQVGSAIAAQGAAGTRRP